MLFFLWVCMCACLVFVVHFAYFKPFVLSWMAAGLWPTSRISSLSLSLIRQRFFVILLITRNWVCTSLEIPVKKCKIDEKKKLVSRWKKVGKYLSLHSEERKCRIFEFCWRSSRQFCLILIALSFVSLSLSTSSFSISNAHFIFKLLVSFI